ncbi:MAG: RecQ family ATP-dependent DNA helicase [Bacteroidales bacterium]|nr:RecQ family ATP-dependent DNA helicase [Bacteroidales bacterium]
MEPGTKKKELLKKYWGYDTFRPLQEAIIDSVLQGNDTLALMPTGGGKSLCYQLPALMLDGLCLVVSPLIALMKDQVQQLNNRGIKAACIVSSCSSFEQSVILNHCLHGKVKVLYVSPERLKQRVFIEHFRQMNVALLAVDEAHCISQWGYDFRPSYLEIAKIRAYHPDIPIIALTATATPLVVEDIQRQLMFSSHKQVLQSSFKRQNLAYMVFHEEEKLGRLFRIARNTGGSGIVYVRNRRRTREIASQLLSNGITATYYHAGLDAKERDTAQKRWMENVVNVIVATNAFGMGIDKPDVRFVVHMDIPNSLEAYFQEAGRAGRDGKKSYAVLLYNDNDLEVLQHNFEMSFPSRQLISNIYRAICNYYQLPIGSGEGCQFDFDQETLCSTYNFDVLEFYSACRFLEREGLIALPDREEAESKVFIPMSREEVYRFQVNQPRYSDLMEVMMRTYGGLFTDFTPISERLLGRRLYYDEKQIANMLRHMDALKAIVYKCKSDKPQITFTAPRIDSKDLYLSDSNYSQQKQYALEKMEAIKQYVLSSNGCRSQMLLDYFGEDDSEPCGICDLCIQQRKQTLKNSRKSQQIRERLLELIARTPRRADELVEAMGDINEEEVVRQLRLIVEERLAGINEKLQFYIP